MKLIMVEQREHTAFYKVDVAGEDNVLSEHLFLVIENDPQYISWNLLRLKDDEWPRVIAKALNVLKDTGNVRWNGEIEVE
ncbi:MAG: hypothetical protein FJZ04_02210 [Candidatus Moranbacteria bacterium]|nr:hypothetical protein [Candidatus Moranbacteria bacterium]